MIMLNTREKTLIKNRLAKVNEEISSRLQAKGRHKEEISKLYVRKSTLNKWLTEK